MTPIWEVAGHFVSEEDNPHLVVLRDEYDSIIQEFNRINRVVVRQYVPGNPGRREQRTYDHLERRVSALQHRMLEWRHTSWSFINMPSMAVASLGPIDPRIDQMLREHVIRCHLTLRTDITFYQTTLASNYQGLVSDALSARDFSLAMKSYRFAIAGLILSLAGLLYSIVPP